MANNENNSSSYDFLINSNAFASMHDDQLIPLHPQSFFDSQIFLNNNPNPISNPIPNPISSNVEVVDTPIPSIYNGPRGPITIESPSIVLDAQKKFRGRPKGSKNKPKVAPNMGPSQVHVIEIKPGFDVMRRVHEFVQTLKTGFYFSGGVGRVRDVLVQTFSAQEPTKSYCGTFQLMNVLGYRFGETSENLGPIQAIFNGPRGVFGGYVLGPLMAVGVVNIFITTCSNYQFYPCLSPNEGYQIQDPSSDGSSNMGEVPNMDPKPYSGMVLESSERNAKRIRK
ncbi:unnamed protein product [Amaranthus hypochondriacus]